MIGSVRAISVILVLRVVLLDRREAITLIYFPHRLKNYSAISGNISQVVALFSNTCFPKISHKINRAIEVSIDV